MTNLFGQEQWARRGEAQTAAATAVSAAMPVGMITAYWGATAPTGWLLCDGAAIPAQYATLIALVGASTPNLKGRVIVGIDGAQVEFDTVGETGGAKTVTLTEAQLAAHDHTDAGHTHFHNHTFSSDATEPPNHGHTFTAGLGGGDIGLTAGASNYNLLEQGKTTAGVNASLSHAHSGTTLTNAEVGIADNQPTGGGGAHTNLQPYVALSYIIKAA